MKIKFQQLNKQEKENTKSTKNLEKQNNSAYNHLSNQKQKRKFGKDITKQQQNSTYNFIASKNANLYQLPSFFGNNAYVPKEIAPYEEDILIYLVNTHDEYDIMQKTKKSLKKRPRRVRVVQYYIAICNKYKLKYKTLFLAAYYYDKYMEIAGSLSCEQQTFSAQACLLMAMKYQEIYPPQLKDWASNPKEIIKIQAKIIRALDFKLAFTTARHYLEIYLGKMPNEPNERVILYECLLEFYLVTGKIYSDHPLKVVQQVVYAFRTTAILQNETDYSDFDRKLQIQLTKNRQIWQKIINPHISQQQY